MKDTAIPEPVLAALENLRTVAKSHGFSLYEVLPVTPNQCVMWEMHDRVQRMRRLLDAHYPGWDAPL